MRGANIAVSAERSSRRVWRGGGGTQPRRRWQLHHNAPPARAAAALFSSRLRPVMSVRSSLVRPSACSASWHRHARGAGACDAEVRFTSWRRVHVCTVRTATLAKTPARVQPPSGPRPLLFTRSFRSDVARRIKSANDATPTGPNALSEMSSSNSCVCCASALHSASSAGGIMSLLWPVKMSDRFAR